MALPDLYSQFTQARQNGAQRADDYTVRQNIGGAVQGDSGALAAILKASPQTGMQVQQYAQGQKKLQQEDAGKAASMFAQTGDPQFYAMWKQSLAGLPNAPQLPDALEPDDIEPAKQSAMAFAQAYGSPGGVPAGVQEFKYMTQGLSAEDTMRARRVSLGLDPRQSSAAIGYQKITGPDGREYLVATDPRGVGAQVIGGGSSYGTAAQPSQGGLAPQRDFASLTQKYGVRPSSTLRSPKHNAEVGGVSNSYHLSGEAADYPVPQAMKSAFIADARAMGYEAIDEGDHVHIEPPRRGMTSGGMNMFASQTPQERKYAEELGQQRAQLDALTERGRLEAENAALKAQAEAAAKAQAERDSQVATKAVDANRTLMLLDQAEGLIPLSTGSAAGNLIDAGAAVFGKSTDGAQAIAALQTIAGQLTSSMPRMQGPQSDRDVQLYKQMAGDLANPTLPAATRIAALKQIRALNQKYATQQQSRPTASQSGGWSIKVKP